MHSTHPLIRFDDLTKIYGSFTAVRDVSFTVSPGEVVGFVGANGAGKTTTINMLLGLIRPTKGTASIAEKEVTTANAHISHRSLGYAAGDMALFDNMTGGQYFAFLVGQSTGDHAKRLTELCQKFSPQLDKKFHTLSRGNKQKIALIGAFLTSPKLVILDEPTSGLDPMMQEVFVELIREERTRGTTIFMSSHYLQEVVDVCTRVLLMKDGRIIHDLTTEQLRDSGQRQVHITTRHKPTSVPLGASDVTYVSQSDTVRTSFHFTKDIKPLLMWLATHKDIVDVEISSHNLEEGFLDLYKTEEKQ